MRARKTDTEIRQEQIARCAMAIISRSGIKSVKVAAVARQIGVVPSGIYRHFKGKDQILDEVLNLAANRLMENVASVRAQSSDSLERLHELLMKHASLVRDEIPIPRVMFSEEIFAGDKRRRSRVFHIFKNYLAEIADIIREGQADGAMRPQLDPDTLALMFLGLIQPAAILWVMSRGEIDMESHARNAWDIFVENLRVKKIQKTRRTTVA